MFEKKVRYLDWLFQVPVAGVPLAVERRGRDPLRRIKRVISVVLCAELLRSIGVNGVQHVLVIRAIQHAR